MMRLSSPKAFTAPYICLDAEWRSFIPKSSLFLRAAISSFFSSFLISIIFLAGISLTLAQSLGLDTSSEKPAPKVSVNNCCHCGAVQVPQCTPLVTFWICSSSGRKPFQMGANILRVTSACISPVSYTHLRAHETDSYLVCRLLLEKKKKP